MARSLAIVVVLAGALPALRADAHGGAVDEAPWRACADLELGAICQWTNGHGATHIGTCRGASAPLRCLRNRPIVYPAQPGASPHAPGAHSHPHPVVEPAGQRAGDWPWLIALALGMSAAVGLTWRWLERSQRPSA